MMTTGISRPTGLMRGLMIGLLCSQFLWLSGPLLADQAQYFYDELGRLIGVVDGQNHAAVYQYDEVGNLLKIDRFTTNGDPVGIFLVSPGSAIAKNPDGTPANRAVEIRGFGFTNPPISNAVAFNGVSATVLSGTSSSLIATVPATATTGPVTVTNSNGTATTSPTVFTVLVPPIITGVEPLKVPQGATTRVLIKGFNLKAASQVQFAQAGFTATILSGATDDVLPVNVAVGATVPTGAYAFSVVSPGGTAPSGTVTIEVTAAVPSHEVASPVSVFNPLPAQMAPPPGPAMMVAPSVSVTLP